MDNESLNVPRQYEQLRFEDKAELRARVFDALEAKLPGATRFNSGMHNTWKRIVLISSSAACLAGITISVMSLRVVSSSAKDYIQPSYQQHVSVIQIPATNGTHPEGASATALFGTNGVAKVYDNYAQARAFIGEYFPSLPNQSVGQYGVLSWPGNGQFEINYSINGQNITEITIWHGAKGFPNLQLYQLADGKKVYYSEDELRLGQIRADVWHIKCDDWTNKEWTYVSWKRGEWTLMVESTDEAQATQLAKELDLSTQQLGVGQ